VGIIAPIHSSLGFADTLCPIAAVDANIVIIIATNLQQVEIQAQKKCESDTKLDVSMRSWRRNWTG
jgi:hypothetical protein